MSVLTKSLSSVIEVYETLTFPADKFGDAIDTYEAAVGKFEEAAGSGRCGATGLPCSGCQPGPCGSRVDEAPAGIRTAPPA